MATFTGQLISATYDAIIKTVDNDPISATAKQLTDGLGNVTPLYVSTTKIGIGITPTEALHISGNTLITGSITINTSATISGNLSWGSLTDSGESITITKFVDAADGIANNNNDTTIPTSAAVKSFVDSSITAQDLDFLTDSGTGQVDLDSQSLVVLGTTNQIDTTGLNQTITLSLPTTIHRNLQGNVTGTVSSLSNHTTSDLSEGTNLYYTASRFNTAFAAKDTDDLSEGSTNLYFTNAEKTKLNGIEAGADVTDATNVLAAGAVMTTGNQSIAGVKTFSNQVTIPATPSANTDAASKGYVDTKVGENNELSEVLSNGNTTGGTDIAVSAGDDITFTDTSKAYFGVGSDLQIYHDGSNSYIDDTGTGHLFVRTNGDGIYFRSETNEEIAHFNRNAGVKLYYDNSLKFESTSYGINVTGAINSDNYISIEGGTNPYLRIQDTTNEKYLNLYSSDNESAIVYSQDTFKISSGVDFLNQTPRLTIDSSGNSTFAGDVTLSSGYVNVTTDGSVAYGLLINSGDQSHSRIRINNTGSGGNAWSIMSGTSGVSNDGFAIRNETTTTTALQFTNSGNATFAGTIDSDNITVGKSDGNNSSISLTANTGNWTFTNVQSNRNLEISDSDGTGTVMTIDTSGNVGINVTDPEKKLEVKSDTTYDGIMIDVLSNPEITLRDRGNSDTLIGTGRHGLDGFHIDTYSGNAFFIKGSNRNVGIGTTNPSRKLHVVGGSTYAALFDSDQDYTLGLARSGTEEWWLKTYSDGRFAIHENGVEDKLTIKAGGNVGIGTTSPSTKLQVNGTTAIINSAAELWLGDSLSGGDGGFIKWNSGSDYLYIGNSYNSAYNTNIVIANTGNVGIGTTSPYAFDTTATKLHIKNEGSSGSLSEVARFEGSADADGSGGTIRLGTSNDRGIYFEGGRTGSVPYGKIGTTEYNGAKTLAITLDNSGNSTFAGTISSSSISAEGMITVTQNDIGTGESVGLRIIRSGGAQIWNITSGLTGIDNTTFNIRNSTNNTNVFSIDNSTNAATFAGTVETTTLRTDVINNKANSANIIYRSGTSTLVGGGSTANKLYILDNGNVGIGTTSPLALLNVNTGASGTHDAIIISRDTHGEAGVIKQASGGIEIHSQKNLTLGADEDGSFTGSSSNVIIKTDGTERMRITSGGNLQMKNDAFLSWYTGAGTEVENLGIEGSDATGTMKFYTEAVERMRIDSSGNVGIGTTGPTARLDVLTNSATGNNDIDRFVRFRADNGEQRFAFSVGRSGNNSALQMYDSSEAQKVNIASGGNSYFNGGNVGIGTTSPSAKLKVIGANDAWTCQIENTQALPYGLSVNTMGTAGTTFNSAFYTHSGTGMYIVNNGKVGIGLTSPQSKLHIGETATVGSNFTTAVNNSQLFVHNVGANTNSNVIFAGGDTGATGGTGAYSFGQNGLGYTHWIFYHKPISTNQSSVGSISSTSTATAYNTSSDYRLKENVVEMTGALDRVNQLRPSRFNFIADADTTVDGFLAHEVQDIVPEAITGEKDAVDEDGNAIYQGIDQSKLVPLLVGAIKELKAEIELLKTQINK